MPVNLVELEKSVLDSVISQEIDFEVIEGRLDVENFSTETHRLIFAAMKSLYIKDNPIDTITLVSELEKGPPRPDGGDWSMYITNLALVAWPMVPNNLDFHVGKLRESTRLGKLERLSYALYESAKSSEIDEVRDLMSKINELEQSEETNPGNRPISAKYLPDEPLPDALWAGLLYPGFITQLNAEPGAGKSTFAYNIATLGAQARDFLGFPFSKRLKALIVDLETVQSLQRKKIEDICGELPEGVYLQSELNLEHDFRILLKDTKTYKFDLIVLDTQSKALAMEDENSNSEANRACLLLSKLAKETNAAVLLIHHTKKSEGGKGVYRGRGASAMAGGVDIVANLETLDRETLKLLVEKSRMPSSYQTITMRKIGNDQFELVEAGIANDGSELHHIQNFIRNLLSDRAEWQTADILQRCEGMSYKTRTTEKAIKQLVESGRIDRIRQGVYKIREESQIEFLHDEDFGMPKELC